MCHYTENYFNYAKNLIKIYKGLKNSPDGDRLFVDIVRHTIFDKKPIRSGLVSESGSNLGITELTKEHFYPRKKTADLILKKLKHGHISPERLCLLIMSRCRVHLVTPEENQRLRKFQTDENIKTWRHEYEAAGIKLVPWTPLKTGRKPK